MIDKNKSSKKPKSSPPTGNTNSLRLHNPGPLRSSNALRGEAWGAGGSRGAARHAAPSCRPGLPTQDAAREGPPRVAICPKEALECPRGEMTRDSTTLTPQKGQKGESWAPPAKAAKAPTRRRSEQLRAAPERTAAPPGTTSSRKRRAAGSGRPAPGCHALRTPEDGPWSRPRPQGGKSGDNGRNSSPRVLASPDPWPRSSRWGAK